MREKSEWNCEKESNKVRDKNVRKKRKNQRNMREKAKKSKLWENQKMRKKQLKDVKNSVKIMADSESMQNIGLDTRNSEKYEIWKNGQKRPP